MKDKYDFTKGERGKYVKICSNLKELPVNERIRLVEDIWDSIASDQSLLSLTTDQKAELDKRLNVYEVTKKQGHLEDEIILGIRKRL